MKTIEEKATHHAMVIKEDGSIAYNVGKYISFQRGAEWMREELTRWRDPKEVLPENNVCVLLKVVDQLNNEAIYLGSREGAEYMTDGGLVLGTDFDDESMPDMNVKVIGWRKIL